MSSWTKPKKFLSRQNVVEEGEISSPHSSPHPPHIPQHASTAATAGGSRRPPANIEEGEISSPPARSFHPRPPHNNRSSSGSSSTWEAPPPKLGTYASMSNNTVDSTRTNKSVPDWKPPDHHHRGEASEQGGGNNWRYSSSGRNQFRNSHIQEKAGSVAGPFSEAAPPRGGPPGTRRNSDSAPFNNSDKGNRDYDRRERDRERHRERERDRDRELHESTSFTGGVGMSGPLVSSRDRERIDPRNDVRESKWGKNDPRAERESKWEKGDPRRERESNLSKIEKNSRLESKWEKPPHKNDPRERDFGPAGPGPPWERDKDTSSNGATQSTGNVVRGEHPLLGSRFERTENHYRDSRDQSSTSTGIASGSNTSSFMPRKPLQRNLSDRDGVKQSRTDRDWDRESRDRDNVKTYGRSGNSNTTQTLSGNSESVQLQRNQTYVRKNSFGGSSGNFSSKFERRGPPGRERRTSGPVHGLNDNSNSRDYYGPSNSNTSGDQNFSRESARRNPKTSNEFTTYRERDRSSIDSRNNGDMTQRRKFGFPPPDGERDKDRNSWDNRHNHQSVDNYAPSKDYNFKSRFRPPPGVTSSSIISNNRKDKRSSFSPPSNHVQNNFDSDILNSSNLSSQKTSPQSHRRPDSGDSLQRKNSFTGSISPNNSENRISSTLRPSDEYQRTNSHYSKGLYRLDATRTTNTPSAAQSVTVSPPDQTSVPIETKSSKDSSQNAIESNPDSVEAPLPQFSGDKLLSHRSDKRDLYHSFPHVVNGPQSPSKISHDRCDSFQSRRDSSLPYSPQEKGFRKLPTDEPLSAARSSKHLTSKSPIQFGKKNLDIRDNNQRKPGHFHPNNTNNHYTYKPDHNYKAANEKGFPNTSVQPGISGPFLSANSKGSFLRNDNSDKTTSVAPNIQVTKEETATNLMETPRIKEVSPPPPNATVKKPFLSIGKPPQPLQQKSPAASESIQGNAPTIKKESTSLTPNALLSPLTCSSLGNNDNAVKAEKVVRKLSLLISKPSLNSSESSGSVLLPSKQQIMTGISDLESKIKNKERDKDVKKMEIEKAKEAEQKKEEKKIEEERRQAEIIRQEEMKKEEEFKRRKQKQIDTIKKLESEKEMEIEEEEKSWKERLVLSEELEKKKKAHRENLRSVHCNEISETEESLKALKKDLEQQKERLIAELNLKKEKQLAQTKEHFDTKVEKSNLERKESEKVIANLTIERKQLDEKVQEVTNSIITENERFEDHTSKLREKLRTVSIKEPTEERKVPSQLDMLWSHLKDNPNKMNEVICSVLATNQNRAFQAHEESLEVIPPANILSNDTSYFDNETVASWSSSVRQITGLADALYTQPCETPFFETNCIHHSQMKLLLREFVRAKRRAVYDYWKRLGHEHIVRQEINEASISNLENDFSNNGNTEQKDGNSLTSSHGRGCGNQYRRPRRGAGNGTNSNISSDVVRSEYEQEQIIAELTAKEAMEKRISQGGSKLPRQRGAFERYTYCEYIDLQLHRHIDDPAQYEEEKSLINPWTDMEKCIFLDRFLQHPKDFKKIASFLRNKTTKDCVKFYYDSKKTVPYKAALKEHLSRKKRRFESVCWEATIQAAISVGAVISSGTSAEKPIQFSLPQSDDTYCTRHFHPIRHALFDSFLNNMDDLTKKSKKKSGRKNQSQPKNDALFTPDLSNIKYLQNSQKEPSSGSKRKMYATNNPTGDSCSKVSKISATSTTKSQGKNKNDDSCQSASEPNSPLPKKTQKWTEEDKRKFYEALGKYGKRWTIIANQMGTKKVSQIKNYYYDHKRQIGKILAANNEEKQQSSNGKRETSKTEPQNECQPPSSKSIQVPAEVNKKEANENSKRPSTPKEDSPTSQADSTSPKTKVGEDTFQSATKEKEAELEEKRESSTSDMEQIIPSKSQTSESSSRNPSRNSSRNVSRNTSPSPQNAWTKDNPNFPLSVHQQQSHNSQTHDQLRLQHQIHQAQDNRESQQQLSQYQQAQHLRFSNDQIQHQLQQRQQFQHHDSRLSLNQQALMHARERAHHQQVMSNIRSVLPNWVSQVAQVQAQARAQSQVTNMQHQHQRHHEGSNIAISGNSMRDWNDGPPLQSASQIQNMKLAMALQHAKQQRQLSLNSQSNQHHHQQQHLNRLALASSVMNNSSLSENDIAVLQQNRSAISPTLSARIAARQRELSLEMMNNESDSSMGLLARMAGDPNRPGSGHESNQR